MTITLYAGADVRDDPDAVGPPWDAERRRQYLLRPDTSTPLSVDRRVWLPRLGPERPSAAAPLPWVTVDQVRHDVAAWPTERRAISVIVAIGVVAADSAERELLRSRGIDTELRLEDDWRFLGYDVADAFDCSGLCNCGYREKDEALVPRKVWAPRLNDHGLLVDLESALEFRALTDRRVPEHAPFFVEGLWIVGARR